MKKRSMHSKAKVYQDKLQQTVYIQRPENEWNSEDSPENLVDAGLTKRLHNKWQGGELPFGKPAQANLIGIPSLTYNQKMENWIALNEVSVNQYNIRPEKEKRGHTIKRASQNKSNGVTNIKQRNIRSPLLERYSFDLPDENNKKDIKYTRLLDGLANTKGDFENVKRNLGVTGKPLIKDEFKEDHLSDLRIREHFLDQREAGQKTFANIYKQKEKNASKSPREIQGEVINGLRKSIRELSMKMSKTNAANKWNEQTVPEGVKCNDNMTCKLDYFQAQRSSVGSPFNSNYFDKNMSKANANNVFDKIQKANRNVSEFLRDGKRNTRENANRRPLLKLFPPTGDNAGLGHISKPYYPPKNYRERKRIREADEFWKKYGKDDFTQAKWNEFRMDLEWKHQKTLMTGPGFPVQMKEKYPLIFGSDDGPVKLSSNFTTTDLIAAMNRIIHHPKPLNEMMVAYNLEIDGYRKKFPRLFRFEDGITPPQPKDASYKNVTN